MQDLELSLKLIVLSTSYNGSYNHEKMLIWYFIINWKILYALACPIFRVMGVEFTSVQNTVHDSFNMLYLIQHRVCQQGRKNLNRRIV